MDLLTQSVVDEIAIICGLSSEEVSLEAWLAEYGIDSIKSLDLVMELEDRYNISVTDQEIADVVKVEDVINLIRTKVATVA